MLNSISHLVGCKVTAVDGDIGKVVEVFFDDRHWTVRHLVVDTGGWLDRHPVLVSPYAVRHPLGADRHVHLSLSRSQVQHSPDVDSRQPVSRQHEHELLSYYQYPDYWEGGGLWGLGALPVAPAPGAVAAERAANRAMLDRDFRGHDSHLRSSAHVTGYAIEASDGPIGQVKDFIYDDEAWAIRYLVVDTGSWWQGGRPVLIGSRWSNDIDWARRLVGLRLTRAQVKASPPFEDVSSIHRDFEQRLHRHYDRPGYWT